MIGGGPTSFDLNDSSGLVQWLIDNLGLQIKGINVLFLLQDR